MDASEPEYSQRSVMSLTDSLCVSQGERRVKYVLELGVLLERLDSSIGIVGEASNDSDRIGALGRLLQV